MGDSVNYELKQFRAIVCWVKWFGHGEAKEFQVDDPFYHLIAFVEWWVIFLDQIM